MSENVQVSVEELRLRNYRAFENARLSLADLTFLVGRNGAGKTTLLDALDLFREVVSDSLENALERRGGIRQVRHAAMGAREKPMLGLAVVFRLSFPGGATARALYGFELQGYAGDPLSRIRECLTVSNSAGASSSFVRTGDSFESSVKHQVSPPDSNLVLPLVARSDRSWSGILDAIRNLRSYEISPAHMLAAPGIGERSTLNHDGSNVGDVLKSIEDTKDYLWVVERLAALTPGIVDVGVENFLGRRVLRFHQKHGSKVVWLDASQVSQGTLRGLAILLALRQHPTPSLVLIDEIENSVHPSALAVLIEAALASCDRTRVVLTSHSPELLSHPAVTGERVRIVEWKHGTSQIFRLSAETQAAITGIDTVGWMLRTNALWPAPEPEVWSGDLLAIDGAEA